MQEVKEEELTTTLGNGSKVFWACRCWAEGKSELGGIGHATSDSFERKKRKKQKCEREIWKGMGIRHFKLIG
jgi:hypothetical protein